MKFMQHPPFWGLIGVLACAVPDALWPNQVLAQPPQKPAPAKKKPGDDAYSRAIAGRDGFTVETWVFLNSYGEKGGTIWSRQGANNVYGYVGPTGFVRFCVGNKWFDTAKRFLPLKRWIQVTFIYHRGAGSVCLNAASWEAGEVGSPPAADKEGINVAEYWDGEKDAFRLDGGVHYVKVYPVALNDKDVQVAYRTGLSADGEVIVSPE